MSTQPTQAGEVTITTSPSQIRILHVLHSLNRGGIETWLYHVLRQLDHQRFHMDFAVATDKPCDYDEEFRQLGSGVFSCLHPTQPWRYARSFREIVQRHGPYQIVHSHFDPCGYPLIWAHRAGIPVRIAHSHNATRELRSKGRILQTLFSPLTHHWIQTYATGGLACGELAAVFMFGKNWRDDRRWRILFYGIDLTPLTRQVNRQQLHASLKIPDDVKVLGHVGRFAEQKNHLFLVDIFAEAAQRDPTLHFVFVGDGPLRASIERKVRELGFEERSRFLGIRTEILDLLKGVVDVFVFPSLFEGLGLAFVEAQAAGVPCVISEAIPKEATLITPLIQRLSLSDPPSVWVKAIQQAIENPKPLSQSEALKIVTQSPFNIRVSCESLQQYYIDCVEKVPTSQLYC